MLQIIGVVPIACSPAHHMLDGSEVVALVTVGPPVRHDQVLDRVERRTRPGQEMIHVCIGGSQRTPGVEASNPSVELDPAAAVLGFEGVVALEDADLGTSGIV